MSHRSPKIKDSTAPGFSQPLPDVVRGALVEILYREAIPGFVVTLVIAAIAAGVAWRSVGAWDVALWLLAVIFVTGARMGIVRAYRAKARAAAEALRWENRYAIGAAAMGITWGALPVVIGEATYALQVFVAFVVGGMTIGALGVLAASRRAFVWFAAPMIAALALRYWYLGGEVYVAMGTMVLVFLVALVGVFQGLHRKVTQNAERGIVNERLIAEQRSLFDAATVGLTFVRDRTLVDWNAEFERIFGWTRTTLPRDPDGYRFPPDATWRVAIEEAYAGVAAGEAFREEIELRCADGPLIWCEVAGRTVIAGRPELGLVISFADITVRRHADAALRESEERLELVVRAAQGGLWDWNILTGEGYVSPRFKEILGYAEDADLASTAFFMDRLHAEDRERVAELWQAALAQAPGPFDCECRIRRADDSYVWVRVRGMVLCDAARQAVRAVGSIIDISDRKAMEERLRESEQHFRHLVETANDLVWSVDGNGCWTYLSPRATREIFGAAPEDMLGRRMIDTQPPDERARTVTMLNEVLGGGSASHFATRHVNRLGDEIVLSLNAAPLRAADGSTVGVTGTAADITALKVKEAELSAALAEQELIFDSVSEGIVFLKRRIVRKCNRKFAEMLGYGPQELVLQPSLAWYANPDEWEQFGRESRAVMARGEVFQAEMLVRRKDGTSLWCDVRGRAVNPQEVDEGVIFVFIDIAARKEREQRIQHLADHDALTGLLNRRLLEDRLQHAINLARRNGTLAAVMLIDLDGFKVVNDQFGHLIGDYALRTIAKRLAACVRESDTVARLGGDEFVVLLTNQHSPENCVVVAEKVLAAFAEPVAAGGRRFMIGASIGISVFPRDGATPEALLKHADAAMYRVKEAGKNRYEFYSS